MTYQNRINTTNKWQKDHFYCIYTIMILFTKMFNIQSQCDNSENFYGRDNICHTVYVIYEQRNSN